VNETSGKCPPQFVFEMMIAQATRLFLLDQKSAEEIVDEMAVSFAELYDIDALANDLLKGIERFLVFIDSVNVDDVDLMLLSYIWYTANYENLTTKRKKKPRMTSRDYNATGAFKTYAYAVGSNSAPVRPSEWTPQDEVEFESVFTLLFPEEDEDNKN
jgi:hypothetical protein